MERTAQPKWQLPEFEVHEFKEKRNNYCVCLPIVNESGKIEKQLARMKMLSESVDIIIADGDSIDGSTEKDYLQSQGVRTLLVKKSAGRQAAQLRMAFAYAMNEGYLGIIQVDGNNKDGVEAIPRFVEALEDNCHYVQGSRFIKGGKAVNTPWTRYLGVRFVVSPLLSAAAKYWYTDVTNGFRAYSRHYLLHAEVQPFRDIFVSYNLNFYLTVRANQLGLKTKEIPVTRVYPRGKVPTKMNSIQSQLALVKESVAAALGRFHP